MDKSNRYFSESIGRGRDEYETFFSQEKLLPGGKGPSENPADIGPGELFSGDNGVEVFNFGKYKGMSVTDVLKRDPGYYSWILNSDFTLNTKAMLTKIRLRELTNK